MTDLELIFTMLREKVTTEISKNEKPEIFEDNRKVAGKARKETENRDTGAEESTDGKKGIES